MKNRWKMYRLFFILLVAFAALSNCTEQKTDANAAIPAAELAQTYCGSCHSYPEPNLLDQASWKNYILPRMGNMMGIYEASTSRLELIQDNLSVLSKLYPEKPLLSEMEWKAIQDFYLENAAEQLEVGRDSTKIKAELAQFKLIKPKLQFEPPSTTLVQFGTDNNIFIGDAHSQSLVQLNEDLQIENAAKVREGAVHLHETSNYYWLTIMGEFSPSDTEKGLILKLPRNETAQLQIPIKNLRRPVHSSYADINNDGLEDIIVSEYGQWEGRLSLYLNKDGRNYERKIIWNQAGAIRTEVHDFDGDGKLDIMSLFGQGNEGMYIHYNLGNANFRTEKILAFSPSNGSSYFALQDLDADGDLDIVYTAGDNADFPPINKPYHGVYYFLNDGKNKFTQSFFYPIHGAYKALVRDYDLDGDLDIAVISFFPDFENTPEESFVYLENDSGNYQATTFPNTAQGRWIVMDAKDYDEDGDEDLILGSLAFEVVGKETLVQQWSENALPFVLLENVAR